MVSCRAQWPVSPHTMMNCQLLQGKHGLTTSPMVFPAKISRLPPEGSIEYDICPPKCNLLPFLGYKNLVLWLVGSLWADVIQVRTNLEDHGSLLGNSCANTPLRAESTFITNILRFPLIYYSIIRPIIP